MGIVMVTTHPTESVMFRGYYVSSPNLHKPILYISKQKKSYIKELSIFRHSNACYTAVQRSEGHNTWFIQRFHYQRFNTVDIADIPLTE